MSDFTIVYHSAIEETMDNIVRQSLNLNHGYVMGDAYQYLRENKNTALSMHYGKWEDTIRTKNHLWLKVKVSGYIRYTVSERRPFLWVYTVDEEGRVRAKYNMRYRLDNSSRVGGYQNFGGTRDYIKVYRPSGFLLKYDYSQDYQEY